MVECLLIKGFTRPYIKGAFLSHGPQKNNFLSYCPSPHRHFYLFFCNLQNDALRKAFLKAHQGQTWKLSSRAGNYFRQITVLCILNETIIPSPQFLELYELHWQQASVTPLPKLLVRTMSAFSLATLESRKSPR